MLSPDDILKLPDGVRRNLRLSTLRKRRKNSKNLRTPPKPYFKRDVVPTKEDVVKFIRANDIRTRAQLKKLNSDLVREVDIKRHFGNWRNAYFEIWGPPTWQTCVSADYILKCILEFQINTESGYIKASSRFPDIIPPKREVFLYWGSFSNLFECARRKDLKGTITEYAKYVMTHNGKFPSPTQLQASGIRIGEGVRIFGGKDKFDKFVAELISGKVI